MSIQAHPIAGKIPEHKCTVMLTFYTAANVHSANDFTNNSHIPSYRKFFHVKPSERYHPAKVFVRSDGD